MTIVVKPLNKPNVTAEKVTNDFNTIYDRHDPYIEAMIIENCTISVQDAEAIEFVNVRFRNVHFKEAKITKMYLRDVVFEKCDLSNAHFEEVTMHRVAFYHCQMTGVIMADGRFNHVALENCNLQFVGMGFCNQKYTSYNECILKQADLYENSLKYMTFDKCELTGVNFTNTSLAGIDLSRSYFDQITVGIANLKGCIVNEEQAKILSTLLGLIVK